MSLGLGVQIFDFFTELDIDRGGGVDRAEFITGFKNWIAAHPLSPAMERQLEVLREALASASPAPPTAQQQQQQPATATPLQSPVPPINLAPDRAPAASPTAGGSATGGQQEFAQAQSAMFAAIESGDPAAIEAAERRMRLAADKARGESPVKQQQAAPGMPPQQPAAPAQQPAAPAQQPAADPYFRHAPAFDATNMH